ncbi:putative post-transcriptional gene silencing PAZ-Argonaute family [Helianthus anomalus]
MQLEPATSAVEISQIVYENISGTSKSPNAIKFACSDTVPCMNIVLNNINIKRTDGKSAQTFFNSVMGFAIGHFEPPAYYLMPVNNSFCNTDTELNFDAAIKSGKLNPKNNYLTSNIHLVGGDGWNPVYFTVRVETDKRYWLKWYASKRYGSKWLASKRTASKPVSARNLIILHGFTVGGDRDTVTKYVVDYFKDAYGFSIQHVHWSCLQLGGTHRKNYMPMEVCKIVAGQRYSRKLNEQQVTALLKTVRQNAYDQDPYAVLLLSLIICSIMAFLRSLEAEDMVMTSRSWSTVYCLATEHLCRSSAILLESSILLGLSLTVPLMVACLSVAIPIWIRNGYQFWVSRDNYGNQVRSYCSFWMKKEKHGGKIILRTGGVLYLFWCRHYDLHNRPKYPVMMWKPASFLVKRPNMVSMMWQFLEDHPGSDGVLVPKDEACASRKDATNDFEDVGHSTTAKSMTGEFYAGDIDASKITSKSKVKYKGSNQAHYNQDKTPEFIIKILQFLVPLVILGVAVGIRFYTKAIGGKWAGQTSYGKLQIKPI